MKLAPWTRALIAGLIWLAGGTILLIRSWSYWEKTIDLAPKWAVPALLLGLVIGAAKGWFVLRKTSHRMINRIESKPGKEAIWRIYPWAFYPLILLMIGFGITLRLLFGERFPSLILAIYVGIGAALVVSSVPYFQAAGRLKGLGTPRPTA